MIRRRWAAGRDPPCRKIHLGNLVVLVESKLAVFRFQVVDVNRSIRGLRRHILVQRIPGHTLNVVVMLCYLPYHLTYGSQPVT